MAERWETVSVRRDIRKALWEWAEWAEDETADPFPQPGHDVHAAARQFREDVLAEPEPQEGNAGRAVCRALDEYAKG